VAALALMTLGGLVLAWLRVLPGPLCSVSALATVLVLALPFGLPVPRVDLRPIGYQDVYLIGGGLFALAAVFGAVQRSWVVNVLEVRQVTERAVTAQVSAAPVPAIPAPTTSVPVAPGRAGVRPASPAASPAASTVTPGRTPTPTPRRSRG
jgi:hypothetical protein